MLRVGIFDGRAKPLRTGIRIWLRHMGRYNDKISLLSVLRNPLVKIGGNLTRVAPAGRVNPTQAGAPGCP
jgi:hypothetical protein